MHFSLGAARMRRETPQRKAARSFALISFKSQSDHDARSTWTASWS